MGVHLPDILLLNIVAADIIRRILLQIGNALFPFLDYGIFLRAFLTELPDGCQQLAIVILQQPYRVEQLLRFLQMSGRQTMYFLGICKTVFYVKVIGIHLLFIVFFRRSRLNARGHLVTLSADCFIVLGTTDEVKNNRMPDIIHLHMVEKLLGIDIEIRPGLTYGEGVFVTLRFDNRHIQHIPLLRVGSKNDGFVFIYMQLLNSICIKTRFARLLDCRLWSKAKIFCIYQLSNHFIFAFNFRFVDE